MQLAIGLARHTRGSMWAEGGSSRSLYQNRLWLPQFERACMRERLGCGSHRFEPWRFTRRLHAQSLAAKMGNRARRDG